MSEREDELQREVLSLREQLADANRALEAMARAEVDAVAAHEAATPLLRSTQEELRKSRGLLQSVFDGSLDALLLADDDGVYVDVNPAACDVHGLTRRELLGKRASDFAPPEYESGAHFRSLLATGQMRGQFPLLRPDGTTRVLDFSAVANVAPGLHLSALRDVTERVAAEEAVRRSEARFRKMIENGQDGISLLDANIRTTYHSPAVERLLGYSLDEAKEMAWQDFVDDDERPKLARTVAEVLKAPGATSSVEFCIRKRDGTRRLFELTATNWLSDPDISAIVANFRDITERKASEAERDRFFELSVDLICISRPDGWFQRLNPAWELTVGWSIDELCARPWSDFIHPEDRESTQEVTQTLSGGGRVFKFVNRCLHKDGTYRWIQWSAIQDAGGLIYACGRDVTSDRAAADRDRLLFTASPLPMWLVDSDSLRILDTNDAALRAYGYSRDELLALTLEDIVVDVDRQSDLQSLRENPGAVGQPSITVERSHRTQHGTQLRVQVTDHHLKVSGRDAILKVIVDVTEAKRLEHERERYIERLRLLELSVSRLNDIVLITKAAPLEGTGPEIVYVNEAFERVFGYASDEVVGKTPRLLQGDMTDRAATARIMRALRRAEPVRELLVNYTKAGVPCWLDINIAPVHDDNGELTHFVAIERDTTDQHFASEALRQAEDRLRQAQKMEAVGNLAGGIAHDFNNLLSVILGYTSLGIDGLASNDALRGDLEEVQRAAVRATELTQQLLAYSRKQMLQPSVVDVSAVVGGLRNMLRRLLAEDIELVVNASAQAGRVFVDPGQLEQVIMNLVVNARDAMPNGGTITLETSRVVLDEADTALPHDVAPGSYTVLAVSDTGTGMDEQTQDRIFDPFFTTKEQGKGTGLGLSTVYGIVKQSSGHILIHSELGRGSTFKIYLPRTEQEEAAAAVSGPSSSLGGGETILLVEDDDAVRKVIKTILQKNGYHVLDVHNATEGILMCEQFEATIHLLITDVIMPKISGKQLADRAVVIMPNMKILFISGYTENTIMQHGVLESGVAFLSKPVVPQALAKKVRDVLEG